MAVSVYAFGTGGKRANTFKDIYFSIEDVDGVGVLYTKTGEYSAILKMENPVQKYSADTDCYYDFTNLMTAVVQTLGEGYALHKQDVFVRKSFDGRALQVSDSGKFLSNAYFRFFNGRPYIEGCTYLVITQESKKSALLSYDNSKWRDFLVKIRKVADRCVILYKGRINKVLDRSEMNEPDMMFYSTGSNLEMGASRLPSS